jgi:hypothetical protein
MLARPVMDVPGLILAGKNRRLGDQNGKTP